jgi:acyl-CoA thioester hydrolase
MAGIMHFSNFFRFMETAENAFYRSLGFSVIAPGGVEPRLGWPRVHAHCDYKHPLRFEDEVEIHLLIREKRSKALSFLFRFNRVHPGPALEVARGTLTIVCVHHHLDGRMTAMTMPKQIADKFEVAPPELLA